jgi:hypothetical protein
MRLKIVRPVPALAGLLAAVSLAITPTADAQGLQLRERWSTRGAPGKEFISIDGMAEARDGTVWVSDPRGGAVYGVAPDAASMRVVARSGNGPGEVRGPHHIAQTPDGGLAVLDLGHNAIEVFDGSSRFQYRIPLQYPIVNPKGFVVLPGNRFVVSGGIYGRAESIHIFGLDGRLSASWLPAPRTINLRAGVLVAGGPLAPMGDGSLLFSRAAPHEIAVFSANGAQVRGIARDRRLLPAIGDDFIHERGSGPSLTRSFRWDFPQSKAVFRLPDGRVLNVVRFYDEGTSLWEIYSVDGRLLRRATVRRAYSPWSLTRSGDVLASYVDPDTQEQVAVRLVLTEQ